MLFRSPFWTSDSAISTETFGYTYPELVGNPSPAAVQKQWDDQYGWARRLTPRADPNVKPRLPEFEPLDLKLAPVFQGITEFKPLTRNTTLLPKVPQPMMRAMAEPAAAQKPLAQPEERHSLSNMAADIAAGVAKPIVTMASAVGLEVPKAVLKAAAGGEIGRAHV